MVSKIRHMTVAQYLEIDDACDYRNEYIDGEIFPMPGGTGNHSALVALIIASLINHLADSDCVVRSSDMRVQIDATKYVYPDVSVVCGQSRFANDKQTILLNPTVVVEVSSPSSLARDYVDKVALYAAVPSIQGYLILDQTRVFAEWRWRAAEGWRARQFTEMHAVIQLEPLGCRLALAKIYRGIVFEQ